MGEGRWDDEDKKILRMVGFGILALFLCVLMGLNVSLRVGDPGLTETQLLVAIVGRLWVWGLAAIFVSFVCLWAAGEKK
jgi:hypothetical protein